jgi:hypothetical protein
MRRHLQVLSTPLSKTSGRDHLCDPGNPTSDPCRSQGGRAPQPSRFCWWLLGFAAVFWGLAGNTDSVIAQDTPPSPEDLRDDELAVSGRYARFERLLSQMADILGREDPERAELLRRAVGKGREERISERINRVVELLESKELGSAVEEQAGVTESLRALLTLLQSEDRRSSVERERERLNELLNDIRGLVEQERAARAAAQNAETPSAAAGKQQQALDESDALLKEVNNHDAAKNSENQQAASGESAATDTPQNSQDPEDQSPQTSEPGSKDTESSPESGEPSSSGQQSPPSDQQQSGQQQSGQQQSGQQQSGQQQSGQQQSGQQQSGQQQTPGVQQLQDAREAMQQALEDLRQQQREKATEQQEQAIADLLEAAGEIEEMLRQLREEEKEMVLAALEARFQRMLTIQTQVFEGTTELAATPREQWLDRYFGRCRELSQQQSDLVDDCSQTAGLLREDGTSVSILLAVEGIEEDMDSAAGWLQESKVGDLTQAVQSDIIEALKELIEATQREMQEMQSERQQPPQQQSGDMQKPPLVELMAEIKVLRSLQVRINRRTSTIDGLLQSDTEESSRLQQQLRELAGRQQKLVDSARVLATQLERH